MKINSSFQRVFGLAKTGADFNALFHRLSDEKTRSVVIMLNSGLTEQEVIEQLKLKQLAEHTAHHEIAAQMEYAHIKAAIRLELNRAGMVIR